MSRFAILLLAIVWVPVNADAQSKVDLAREVEQLLRIHESDRRAHFETSAKQIMEHAADEFISVSNGRVQRTTPAENLQFFEEYFKGAKYYEWDDLEPPIVRVSNDASMAWMIVRTRVHRVQTQSDGKAAERRFVYAGIMAYEKKGGRWVRVANVSTFEPLTVTSPRAARTRDGTGGSSRDSSPSAPPCRPGRGFPASDPRS